MRYVGILTVLACFLGLSCEDNQSPESKEGRTVKFESTSMEVKDLGGEIRRLVPIVVREKWDITKLEGKTLKEAQAYPECEVQNYVLQNPEEYKGSTVVVSIQREGSDKKVASGTLEDGKIVLHPEKSIWRQNNQESQQQNEP